jgi:hypothetical protein
VTETGLRANIRCFEVHDVEAIYIVQVTGAVGSKDFLKSCIFHCSVLFASIITQRQSKEFKSGH